jgi:hypothetical protein
VITTRALFARKVQRKLPNGVGDSELSYPQQIAGGTHEEAETWSSGSRNLWGYGFHQSPKGFLSVGRAIKANSLDQPSNSGFLSGIAVG